MADDVETEELLGEALATFDADQSTVAAPAQRDHGERLGKEFDFAHVQLTQADGGLGWMAAKGRVGDIQINAAHGGPSELLVQVIGGHEAARDALTALWRHLAGDNAKPLGSQALISDRTTAIVRLPVDVDTLWPMARLLTDRATNKAKDRGLRVATGPLVRFHVELTMTTGTRNILGNVIFEPRAIARPGSRIYFTQSPLPSDEHLQMVREVVAMAKARSSN